MTHPLNSLIDQIMARAERNGDLDNLPGAGKPLQKLHQPKDAVIDKLLKENRAKPAAVVLKQKISASRDRLSRLTGEDERKAEMKVLSDLQMRLAIEMEALRKFS